MNPTCQSQNHAALAALLTVDQALQDKYTRMVSNLEKDPLALLDEWTRQPWRVSINHGLLGVAGEVGEIVSDILNSNVKSLIKELGDACYYSALVTIGLKAAGKELGFEIPEGADVEFCGDHFQPVRDLQISLANLIDAAKQITLYNKEVTDERLLAIFQANSEFQFSVIMVATRYGFGVDDVLQGNIDKLNLRYPEGSYEDKFAAQRLDEASQVPAPDGVDEDAFKGKARANLVQELIKELRALTPVERVERLRHVHGKPTYVFDVRTGIYLDAAEAFGTDFSIIVLDEITERWDGEIPGGVTGFEEAGNPA